MKLPKRTDQTPIQYKLSGLLSRFAKYFSDRKRTRKSQEWEFQVERLEPRMMLNGDPGDLVFQADFEDVAVAEGKFGFFQQVSGLTATRSPVEIQHNHPAVGPASQGNQHLELDGTNGVYVDLTNVPSSGLLLQLDYSARKGFDALQNTIQVLWNGNVIGSLAADGRAAKTTDFNKFEFTLSGQRSSGRLEFRSITQNDTLGAGGLLDDIRVYKFDIEAQPPTLQVINDIVTTVDETVSVELKATDPDSSPSQLRYTALRSPVGSTLDPITGEFKWTPNRFAAGYRFGIDVRVTDESGLNDTKTFRITVSDVDQNQAPVLEAIADRTIDEGQPIAVQLMATDPDSVASQLTYAALRAPVGSTLDPITGLFRWTPNRFAGGFRFGIDVQVTDETGLTDTKTFRINVNDVVPPQAPVLQAISELTVTENQPVVVQLVATDTDSNPSQLRYSTTRSPIGSTLNPVTGEFRWTPNRFAGGYRFGIDVAVTDQTGLTDTQTLIINVNDLNAAPVLAAIDAQTVARGDELVFVAVATDADRPIEMLNYSLSGNVPAGAMIDSTSGRFSWTPTESDSVGSYAFEVVVQDQRGNQDSQTVEVTVTPNTETIELVEGNRFQTTAERSLQVTDNTKQLIFEFESIFDRTDLASINDVFEVALLDAAGESLVHTVGQGRDAFFNRTEGESHGLGVNTFVNRSTVRLDLSHIAPGTAANLVFRLVNNDSDANTRVKITSIATSQVLLLTPLGQAFQEQPASNGPVDVSAFSDVTGSLAIEYGQTSFNQSRDRLFSQIEFTNIGQLAIAGRMLAVLDSSSDPRVQLVNPDGRLPDGRFYIELFTEGGVLSTGQTTVLRDLILSNPGNEQFDFDLRVLAELNVAPIGFLSTPPTEVEAGKTLRYTAVAEDPNPGQALKYSIVAGHENISIDEDSGELTWVTTMDEIGSHVVTIAATDPLGLFVEQTFSVAVLMSLQNRPPIFTTNPNTEAIASSGFEVTTIATGDQPNGVGVIGGFQGPRIVTINSDDQTVGIYQGTGNDRFDDETTYATGEPARTGNAIQAGYTVDVGLPAFVNNTDANDILGVDQADFNGDGILDLVSLTYHRSNVLRDGHFHDVVVNFGDGNGGFGEPMIIEQFDFTGRIPFENFTVADLNNDGASDLVWSQYQQFSSSFSFTLYTILGNGDGTFQPAVTTNDGTPVGDFRVVDLDNDGKIDLVGRRQFVDDIGWLKGLGDGTFEEFISLSPEDSFTFTRNDRTRAFQVLDLDGDGDNDIVQGRRADKGIQVLTNDGSLNFTETAVLGAITNGGGTYYQGIQVADFTGDGFLDVFFGTYDTVQYGMFKGTTDGFEPTSVLVTAREPHRAPGNPAGNDRPVDIDGDGDLDLLIGHTEYSTTNDNGARVLINDGTGFFSNTGYFAAIDSNGQPNPDAPSNWTFTAGVLSGDYNRDGVTDLVVYDSGTGQFGAVDFNSVSVLLGTRPGEFASGQTRRFGEAQPGDVEVVAADFNNDGITDVLTLGGGMISLGVGDGTFAEPFQATPGRVGDHAVLADFDNDGNIDILLAAGGRGSGNASGFHQVILGNGDGTFEQSYLELEIGGGYQTARVADFNQDGYLDFISKGGFGHIEVKLNDPANPGDFASSFLIDLEATTGYGQALDVGDFNEDGIVDFVTVERTDNLVRLQTYAGLGDGTFELINEEFDFAEGLTSVFNTFGSSPNINLHVGDVNNDGHLDAVNFTVVGNLVHLGNGDGTFAKPTFGSVDSTATINSLTLTSLIDFDEDGNLDLVRVDPSGVASFNRGFGDGTFAMPERYNFANVPGTPQIVDIDHDGHLDLVFRPGHGSANLSSQTNVLYGSRDGLVDLLAVDLNGDGNEEVLAINEDNDRLKIFVGDNLGGLTRLSDVLVGRAPRAVATADLDGDGTLEVITANRAGRSISVLTGDLESGYVVVDFAVDGAPVDVEVADINGDGNDDIVVLDEANRALWIFTGNGTTTLDAPVALALGDVASKFVLADANDDGRMDAVVTLPETHRVMILGAIGFQPVDAPIYVDTESAPSDVAVVDLNDDGNVDLAITLPESNVLSVHYGLGNNQFARAQQITVGETPTRVIAADADEDGRIDLIVTNSGDDTASVIYNRFDPNEVYRYDADAIDPDGDAIAYRVVDGPGGLFINASTGELLWAASPDQVGLHTVTIEANDGNGGLATQQFVIDVQPSSENSSPLIATEPMTTIGANESFEYQVHSIDDDNDSLRYRLIDGPEGATIDPITGLLQWDGRTDAAVKLGYGGIGTSTSGRVNIPADPSLQPANITVEAWYNFHEITPSNGRMTLMKQVGGLVTGGIFNGLPETTYSLHINGNRELVLQLDLGPEGTETFDLVTPFVAETDRWYHFAFSFDDATREATIYVDGVALASGISTSPLIYDTSKNSQVGEQDRFETYATIDNYRIWNVARSAADLQEGMTRQYEDNDQIVLDYRFEDNNTNSIFDHSSSENTGFLAPIGRRPIAVPGLANVGVHSFTIAVEDGRGGMSMQTFEVQIVPELRGAISGTIFDDANGDGVQNDGSDLGIPAESGLSNWLVFVDANDNQFADPNELQIATDADGNYRFDRLLSGDYPIRTAPVAGFESVELQEVTVNSNDETRNDVAAKQSPLSQIQGRLTTADNEAISYWQVYADLNQDGVRDENEPTAVSDRDGFFALTGLNAGDYDLRMELPAGWAVDGNDKNVVSLGADEISTGHDFQLVPTNTSATGGVHFVTTSPTAATARDVFRYASFATGIGELAINYDLSFGPDGLSIDPNTGQVVWLPTIDQLGEQLVILRASAADGSIALQSFTVVVAAPNVTPVITSDAPTVGFVGKTFAYDVFAQDADRDALTYAILAGGSGATIDSQGRLRWTPDVGDVGNVEFRIEVRDADGNSETQSFVVAITNGQPNANPFQIISPRTTVGFGQPYRAKASGTDQLGRVLDWSLVSGPAGLMVDSNGMMSWNPTSADLGTQTIALLATNPDGETEAFEFTLVVVGRSVNEAPVIASSPWLSAVIGTEYRYDLRVTDSDHDMLSFSLVDAPQGMSIDASRGTIRWTPSADQIGDADVTVEVTDPDGATDTQTFTLKVSRAGGPPLITSVPPTEVSVGFTYLYSVSANDAEGNPLTYRLLTAPTGATINASTGEIAWTPTLDQTGQQAVVIEVIDGFGGASTQAFAVLVTDGVANQAPSISSEAPRFAAVGSTYEYQMVATDPESTAITYSVLRGPSGLTIDASGFVNWTPAAGQTGQFVVTLLATDADGASAIESFELDVLAQNQTPTIDSAAPTVVFAGEEFGYDVLASDADLDRLTFALTTGPAGASIDAFGRIRWSTDNDLIGTHDFEVRVSDPRGGSTTQSFSLTVVADTVAPTLLLTDLNNEDGRNILPWMGPIRIFAKASDNVGIASLTLTANGEDLPIDGNGIAALEFEDYLFATITVVATATDVNGNVTTKTIEVDYDYPEGWDGAGAEDIPTAAITSPAEAGTVVGLASIVGTASHENFGSYTLSYRRFDDLEFTTITTSDTAVENGELGVWDTSLLRNDEYVLRLEVESGNGVINVVEQNVGLAGELKLGNFQLQFTDMVIPVAGIPIEITRVYDTLQADVEGEFGFGWRLDFRDTNLQVGLPKSGLEDIGIYSAFRPGVKVYLDIPGQGRQGFTFNPEIKVLPGLGNDNLTVGRPRFTADPGVTSTLSTGVNGYLTVNERGEFYAGGVAYNPAAAEFGGAFVLTTDQGVSYRIDGSTGQLDSATDRNGNRLTFSDSGIVSDGGVGVVFEKNAAGQITRIVDPNGNGVAYQYESGRLVATQDRLGNLTQYLYESEQANFLTELIDPLGRTGLRTQYGADGRLQTRAEEFNDASITFEQRLDDRSTLIRLADGSEQILRYNDAGEIVEVVDELGNVTSREYDEGGLSRVVDADGNEIRYERNSRGDITKRVFADGTAERFSYDSEGNLVSTTDQAGVSTTYKYDKNGNLIERDDGGLITRQTFDEKGNLILRELPDGSIETFEFDSKGFLLSQTIAGREVVFGRDSNGNETRQTTEVERNGNTESLVLTRQFDANGNPLAIVDSAGIETRQAFDVFNNVTSITSSTGRTAQLERDGRPQLQGVTFADGTRGTYSYNERNFLIESIAPSGEVLRFEYDEVGNNVARIYSDETSGDDSDNPRETFEYDALRRIVAQTNVAGERTEFTYNQRGQLVSETNGLGETKRFDYDAVGNLVRQTDPAGEIFEFKYDSRGNLIETIFPDLSVETRIYDSGNRVIEINDPLGAITRFGYDQAGNLNQVIDAVGNTTRYEYDTLGNLRASIAANGVRTEFEFDRRSNAIGSELADGSTIDRTLNDDGRIISVTGLDGAETTYTYNENGQLAEKSYFDGSVEQFTYDAVGRVTQIVDVNGETTTEYNSRGLMTRFVSPNGEDVRYEYDALGRRTAVITDGVRTEYLHDEAGRIISVRENETEIASNQYDNRGNLIATIFGNGVREERTYNSRSQLTGLRILNAAGDVLRDSQTQYDAIGQIISETEGSDRFVYSYDDRGQLIAWVRMESDVVVSASTLEYDEVGNLVRRVADGVETTFTYNSLGQLIQESENGQSTQFDYDGNGNLVSASRNGEELYRYTWDPRGRLTKAELFGAGPQSTTTYEYDYSGLLIRRVVDGVATTYAWDRSQRVPVIIAATEAGETEFFFHSDRILGRTTNEGDQYYYHADASLNVRAQSGSEESLVLETDYAPFGQILNEEFSVGFDEAIADFEFAGELFDDAIGLTYLRQRYLDSDTQRFLSRDPFAGEVRSPLSQQPYQYALNSPLIYSDPTGEFAMPSLAELSVAQNIASTLSAISAIQVLGNYAFSIGSTDFTGILGSVEVSTPSLGVSTGNSLLLGGFGSDKSFTGYPDDSNYSVALGIGVGFTISAGLNRSLTPIGASFGTASVNLGLNPVTRFLRGTSLTGAYVQLDLGYQILTGESIVSPLTIGFAYGSASGGSAGTNFGAGLTATFGAYISTSFAVDQSTAAKVRMVDFPKLTDGISAIRRSL